MEGGTASLEEGAAPSNRKASVVPVLADGGGKKGAETQSEGRLLEEKAEAAESEEPPSRDGGGGGDGQLVRAEAWDLRAVFLEAVVVLSGKAERDVEVLLRSVCLFLRSLFSRCGIVEKLELSAVAKKQEESGGEEFDGVAVLNRCSEAALVCETFNRSEHELSKDVKLSIKATWGSPIVQQLLKSRTTVLVDLESKDEMLEPSVVEQDVFYRFSCCGNVETVQVLDDSRGAIVKFDKASSAAKAIEDVNLRGSLLFSGSTLRSIDVYEHNIESFLPIPESNSSLETGALDNLKRKTIDESAKVIVHRNVDRQGVREYPPTTGKTRRSPGSPSVYTENVNKRTKPLLEKKHSARAEDPEKHSSSYALKNQPVTQDSSNTKATPKSVSSIRSSSLEQGSENAETKIPYSGAEPKGVKSEVESKSSRAGVENEPKSKENRRKLSARQFTIVENIEGRKIFVVHNDESTGAAMRALVKGLDGVESFEVEEASDVPRGCTTISFVSVQATKRALRELHDASASSATKQPAVQEGTTRKRRTEEFRAQSSRSVTIRPRHDDEQRDPERELSKTKRVLQRDAQGGDAGSGSESGGTNKAKREKRIPNPATLREEKTPAAGRPAPKSDEVRGSEVISHEEPAVTSSPREPLSSGRAEEPSDEEISKQLAVDFNSAVGLGYPVKKEEGVLSHPIPGYNVPHRPMMNPPRTMQPVHPHSHSPQQVPVMYANVPIPHRTIPPGLHYQGPSVYGPPQHQHPHQPHQPHQPQAQAQHPHRHPHSHSAGMPYQGMMPQPVTGWDIYGQGRFEYGYGAHTPSVHSLENGQDPRFRETDVGNQPYPAAQLRHQQRVPVVAGGPTGYRESDLPLQNSAPLYHKSRQNVQSSGEGSHSQAELNNSRLYVRFDSPLEDENILRENFEMAAPGFEYVSRHSGKTFAFVKYSTAASATLALHRLDGVSVEGKKLRVSIANPPRPVRKRQRTSDTH